MKKLLIDEPPLQLLPSLVTAIGLKEAIFLQQLHYWLDRSRNEHDGRRWTYNTFEDWQEKFPFWSLRTMYRIVKSLRRQKLIIVRQFDSKDWDQRNWYTIDYEAFNAVEALADARQNGSLHPAKLAVSRSCQNGSMESAQVAESLKTETPSEITSKEHIYAPPTLSPENGSDPQQARKHPKETSNGSENTSAGVRISIPIGYSPPRSVLTRMTANLDFDRGEDELRVKQWRRSRRNRKFTDEADMLDDLDVYLATCSTNKRK